MVNFCVNEALAELAEHVEKLEKVHEYAPDEGGPSPHDIAGQAHQQLRQKILEGSV